MKTCKNCGIGLSDDAIFCNSCGAQLDNEANSAQAGGYQQVYTPPVQPQYPPMGQMYSAAPVSTGGWIGRMFLMGLLAVIPVIGVIIDIILLCVWMGDKSREETFRNWAKAQLVMMLIAVGIVVIIFVLAAVFGVALFSSLTSVGSSYMY